MIINIPQKTFVKGLSDEERAVYENTNYEEFTTKLDNALNSCDESISGMTLPVKKV